MSSITSTINGLSLLSASEQKDLINLFAGKGFVPIPLLGLREAASMDVGAIAANGGVLASDTTPILEAINAATDGCQRISWVATDVDAVIAQVPLPPDLDELQPLELHLRMASSGTTDAQTVTVDTFFNEGDTRVVDTSGTVQVATYAEFTVTIAATDVPSGAQTLTMELTPGTHANDALYLTAAWLEYTKSTTADLSR